MRPPNEQRNFVHGRIIGAVGGFLTGGVTGALGGAIRGGRRKGGSPQQFATSAGPPAARRDFGSQSAFLRARASGAQCPADRIRVGNRCVKPSAVAPFGQPFITPLQGPGTAMVTTGVYSPQIDMQEIRRCGPGDVLGKDGFCHPKGSIPNKQREWPRGRRPLGTPGEMAALAKAASFGRRMETTVKRMQKIGVLKRPKSSRPRITSAAQHHAGG